MIPRSWKKSKLGEIGTYINGMAFKPSDWKSVGTPIIRIQNLTNNLQSFNYCDQPFDKMYEINNNDILISWSASIGVFRWNRGRAVLNQHIFKAIPNALIDYEFFYHTVHDRVEKIKRMTHGTTMKHIRKKPFLNVEIYIPSSMSEQKKIASILSNVDALVEKTDEIICYHRSLKHGLMQKLLITGIDHEKFKIKKSYFGKFIKIPNTWNIRSLHNIGKIITGSTPNTNIKEYYGDEYLWATPFDLTSNKYIKQTFKRLSKKGFKIMRTVPPKSVLVTCIGSTIGKIALAEKTICTNQQINSIVCFTNSSEFIYYQLLFNRKKISQMANQMAVPILNKTDFSTFKILVPDDIDEQIKIASILSVIASLFHKPKQILCISLCKLLTA